ncbi:hypothetical protein BTN50_1452 [Candidatus Enterovibrio altilux]|uniref:Uncharacterized protein n=1 Tax=Candidatus Enterovibrio altilux TaxID=1927128 RepID=A0A291BA78_9GAMM|nr:hypothetical protein BTN50_1452 [Candidatus Enterovibrio luxaltus]
MEIKLMNPCRPHSGIEHAHGTMKTSVMAKQLNQRGLP